MDKKTILACSLMALAAMARAVPASAQEMPPEAQEQEPQAIVCDGSVQYDVRSHGESQPVAAGDDPGSLQENRRVEVASACPWNTALFGRTDVAGQFTIDLPNGGVVWATEDPALVPPALDVQTGSTASFADGRIARPLRFRGYSNYPSFIERLEIVVYRGSDTDLVAPLARVAMPGGVVMDAEWDGALPADANLQVGDDLLYVARAYGADGAFDETAPRRIQLVTPADYDRGRQVLRDATQRATGQSLDVEAAEALDVTGASYGHNALRVQNIPVHGSRVRIRGMDVPEGMRLSIDGQSIPIDLERKFAAEFLEPIGKHRYVVGLEGAGLAAPMETALEVDVTGRYMFLVALADLTLSSNDASGNLEPLAGDEHYDESFISEGRLAFYLKGKVKGKYLVTAQADTRERELDDLFSGFLKARPTDVFRRLDPDSYYPVYGDDSTTYRDVDTQGRLYVRVDWDRSQALWGNFSTGITGTEYAQYQRSLYGAALGWRSRRATALGEAGSQLKLFGSEAQSALGHSEFLGTGGSLYYLRHTDILPGSERIVLEVRDRGTGRVETRVDLQRGADYEIDELQGRILLTRPLAQVTRENVRTLVRDAPLDGYEQLLLADYEYVPQGFDEGNASVGFRGKHWFGDHFALGGTYVDENRGGDDYSLQGLDMTLQAGRGTYLKVEQSRTEATVAPVFYSDNGGLSFVQRNPETDARHGEARAIEARANFRELGWTKRDWSVGAWWREVDAGYSVARADSGLGIEEYGAEFTGQFSEALSMYGRWSRAERGGQALEQGQLTLDWRIGGNGRLGAELQSVREERLSGTAEAMLAALSYRQRIGDALELYGVGQLTLDDDGGAYERNNLLTLGGKYLFGDRSSVGAEVSGGSRGHGARLEAEYRMTREHSLYGAYRYSTNRSDADPLFASALQSGWTLGQRWRLSNQVNIYNESQYLKDTRSDSTGIAHTFGMDFYPAQGWNLGFSLQDGDLDAATGHVDRRAYSLSGGRTSARAQWSSKLEYRRDSGAEQRTQWVTTNHLFLRVNEDWRIAARANYADTDDRISAQAGAKLAEVNMGFAWRPHDNTRWAVFGKYSYLYDLATLGQIGGASYDQRSQVLSLEGVAQLDDRWEVAGKLAGRWGDYRMGRGAGAWLDSRADFAALQLRYRLLERWDALVEYRWLGVRDGGDRKGFLVGVDRQLSRNFRVGLGYNFTDFSDDMTHLRYDNKGWFLNIAGYY